MDGGEFLVYKGVFVVNSSFFLVMFIVDMLEKDKVSVSLRIISVVVMESLLEFMYIG